MRTYTVQILEAGETTTHTTEATDAHSALIATLQRVYGDGRHSVSISAFNDLSNDELRRRDAEETRTDTAERFGAVYRHLYGTVSTKVSTGAITITAAPHE